MKRSIATSLELLDMLSDRFRTWKEGGVIKYEYYYDEKPEEIIHEIISFWKRRAKSQVKELGDQGENSLFWGSIIPESPLDFINKSFFFCKRIVIPDPTIRKVIVPQAYGEMLISRLAVDAHALLPLRPLVEKGHIVFVPHMYILGKKLRDEIDRITQDTEKKMRKEKILIAPDGEEGDEAVNTFYNELRMIRPGITQDDAKSTLYAGGAGQLTSGLTDALFFRASLTTDVPGTWKLLNWHYNYVQPLLRQKKHRALLESLKEHLDVELDTKDLIEGIIIGRAIQEVIDELDLPYLKNATPSQLLSAQEEHKDAFNRFRDFLWKSVGNIEKTLTINDLNDAVGQLKEEIKSEHKELKSSVEEMEKTAKSIGVELGIEILTSTVTYWALTWAIIFPILIFLLKTLPQFWSASALRKKVLTNRTNFLLKVK